MIKNKKILHKINCYFHFWNIPKYVLLNLLKVDDVFVCHEPLFLWRYVDLILGWAPKDTSNFDMLLPILL